MVFDRTENEPEEYDPEAELRDPDSDSLTIPQVSTENAGSDLRSDLQSELEDDLAAPEESVADAEVSAELLKEFWALVLVVNVAVLALALGVLFLVFEGATTIATYLVAAGLALSGLAARRYRAFEREDDSSSGDESGVSGDDPLDDSSANSADVSDEFTDEDDGATDGVD